MEPKALIRISLAVGVVAAIGGIGCSLAAEEEGDSNPDAVTAGGDVSQVLKSTLQIDGCTAAKVGPRHLLVAARCVSEKAAFAAGKSLAFRASSSGKLGTDALTTTGTTAPTELAPVFCPALAVCCAKLKSDGVPSDVCEAEAARKDEVSCKAAHVGYTVQASCDPAAVPSGTPRPATPATPTTPVKVADATVRTVTIAAVKIHPSFAAKCTSDLCDFGKVAAAESADIALIVLDKDLEGITTIPVDLDPVGEADPLLVVNSGCASVDVKPTSGQKTASAIAVPVKNVTHTGSAYKGSAAATKSLAGSYVVTPGAGWKSGDPRLCPTDIGAPVFRATQAAIAGVTSNYTAYTSKSTPVTVEHTRVDSSSTLKIGQWLTSNGAETIHSCSDTTEGCKTRSFTGNSPSGVDGTSGSTGGSLVDSSTSTPDVDGGVDGSTTTPTVPDQPSSGNLSSGDTNTNTNTNSNSSDTDAGAAKKKKAADKGGCSAAPGSTSQKSGGFLIGLALALGAVVARRRRAT